MATVYRAFHQGLGREVALKILRFHTEIESEQIKRFQLEAHLVSTLAHPNITAVMSFGTYEGVHYVAFEYLEGLSLSDFVELNGPLSFDQFISVITQVCHGMECAHDKGIVHRDLKPSNIFLLGEKGGTRRAKILDFGIAKALPEASLADQNLTGTGKILGTPMYMSPEQCNSKPVDLRSDVYALGCVMFYCMSGKPPFDGDSAYEILYLHDNNTAPQVVLPTGYPADMVAVVSRCLEKKPEQRYQTMKELREDLEALQAGKTLRLAKKRKLPIAVPRLALLIGMLLLALCGWLIFRGAPADLDIVHHWTEQQLRSGWESGSFEDLYKQIRVSHGAGETEWPAHLVQQAKPWLSRFPCIPGANVYQEVMNKATDADVRSGYELSIWRILRSMPENEYSERGHDSPLAALVRLHDSSSRENSKSSRDRKRRACKELVARGNYFLDRDQISAAESIFDKAIAISEPVNRLGDELWEAWFWTTGSLWCHGQTKESLKVLDHLLKAETVAQSSGTHVLHAMLLRSQILASDGNYSDSMLTLLKAESAINLVSPPSVQDLAELHFDLAGAYAHANNKARALKELKSCIAAYSASPNPALRLQYVNLVGTALNVLGDHSAANALFSEGESLYGQIPRNLQSCPFDLARANALFRTKPKERAYEAAGTCLRKVAGGLRSCFQRWLLFVPMEMRVVRRIDQHKAKENSDDNANAIEQRLQITFDRASWHGSTGHMRLAAEDLNEAASILTEVGDKNGVAEVKALSAKLAAEIGWMHFAAQAYSDLLELNVNPFYNMRANLGLAKIDRRRLDDSSEERHLDAAADELVKMPVLRDNVQPEFIAERCSLYARLNKWDKVLEVADAERALSRHTKASLGIEWLRQWGEPYSMALRKHGRDSEANAILDRIDHYEKNTKAAGLLPELPPDVR